MIVDAVMNFRCPRMICKLTISILCSLYYFLGKTTFVFIYIAFSNQRPPLPAPSPINIFHIISFFSNSDLCPCVRFLVRKCFKITEFIYFLLKITCRAVICSSPLTQSLIVLWLSFAATCVLSLCLECGTNTVFVHNVSCTASSYRTQPFVSYSIFFRTSKHIIFRIWWKLAHGRNSIITAGVWLLLQSRVGFLGNEQNHRNPLLHYSVCRTLLVQSLQQQPNQLSSPWDFVLTLRNKVQAFSTFAVVSTHL